MKARRSSGEAAIRAVLFSTTLIVGIWTAMPAFANWWIVRSSDQKCLVVDIEPTEKDKGVSKVGKNSYQTAEEAEADVKHVCPEAKAFPKPPQP